MTEGRGADLAIVAAANPRAIEDAQSIVRRGGRVLLFAQTVPGEMIPVDASRICVEEKKLIGSYSASIELQEKAAHMIFTEKDKCGQADQPPIRTGTASGRDSPGVSSL